MPWGKLDDQFDDQPEIDYMSTDAIALFVCSITWSCRNLTDGFIPSARARKLPGGHNRKAVEELLEGEKPWWVEVDGGFAIRSFLKYNPSGEDFQERREEISRIRSEAGKKGAAKTWGAKQKNGNTDGKSDSKPHGKTSDLPLANAIAKDEAKPMANGAISHGKKMAPNPESRIQSDPELPETQKEPPNPLCKIGGVYGSEFSLPWGMGPPKLVTRLELLRFDSENCDADIRDLETGQVWTNANGSWKEVGKPKLEAVDGGASG